MGIFDIVGNLKMNKLGPMVTEWFYWPVKKNLGIKPSNQLTAEEELILMASEYAWQLMGDAFNPKFDVFRKYIKNLDQNSLGGIYLVWFIWFTWFHLTIDQDLKEKINSELLANCVKKYLKLERIQFFNIHNSFNESENPPHLLFLYTCKGIKGDPQDTSLFIRFNKMASDTHKRVLYQKV